MRSEQEILSQYEHDIWGTGGSDWCNLDDVEEAIEREIDEVAEMEGIEETDNFSGVICICGGDFTDEYFHRTIDDTSDAYDLLEACAESDWSTKRYSNQVVTEYLETDFYERIIEGNYEYSDPYCLEKKTERTIERVFYRAAKVFRSAWNNEDEEAMQRAAKTFLRRFKRSTRKIPPQHMTWLFNFTNYEVTITNGKVTDMVIANG